MKKEDIKIGMKVKVPFTINSRGDVRLVPGKVVRIHGESVSVDLTGEHKGYSVSLYIKKLKK